MNGGERTRLKCSLLLEKFKVYFQVLGEYVYIGLPLMQPVRYVIPYCIEEIQIQVQMHTNTHVRVMAIVRLTTHVPSNPHFVLCRHRTQSQNSLVISFSFFFGGGGGLSPGLPIARCCVAALNAKPASTSLQAELKSQETKLLLIHFG